MSFSTASRKRRLLAIYIDFVLFSSVLILFEGLLLYLFDSVASLVWWQKLIFFSLIELPLLRFVRWSPGHWLLGIRVLEGPGPVGERHLRDGERLAVVDPALEARESAWTMALGTLLLIEGSKALSRWVGGEPSILMGALGLPALWTGALSLLSGALFIFVGGAVLRLHRNAIWGILVLVCAQFSLLVVAWGELGSTAADRFAARRKRVRAEAPTEFVDLMLTAGPWIALGKELVTGLWGLKVARDIRRLPHGEAVA